MHIRPTEARWFEAFTPRDDTVRAIELLARTGGVQLEVDPRFVESADTEKLRHFVQRFQTLAAPYASRLPGTGQRAGTLVGDPVHLANLAVHRLRVWQARHDYLSERLEQVRAELDELDLLAECVAGMAVAGLDFEGIFRRTPLLCKCLFACPRDSLPEGGFPGAVETLVQGARHRFLYVAATPDQKEIIQAMVVGHGCLPFGLPQWLSSDQGLQQSRIRERRQQARADAASLETQLHQLESDVEMGQAHANIQTLAWFLEHAPGLLAGHALCHITGWCTGPDPAQLEQRLSDAGIRATVRFPLPPVEARPPVDLLSRWWTLPFRPFLQLWGVPGRAEVDPSGLLPLLIPLLFGYMFPDVGHGLVIALIGLALHKRAPQLRFLLPCGVSAMAFGLVFGEVFGFSHLVAPLWLHPLQHPLPVILVPMALGVLLILLGMLFAGIEAHWRGELKTWLQVDAAVLLLYLSLLGAWFSPLALVLSGLALIHYFAGNLVQSRPMAEASGQLLLSVFELAMNTLSFVRVGAFALAHAALSQAIMTLAEGAPWVWLWVLVIVLGSLFSIVLEGLLVYVQTTRLVLFEFFTRFLHAEGRLFNSTRPPSGPNQA